MLYDSLYQELAYVKSAYPTLVGFSVWAAGSFATNYILSMTPYANGTDQPLWDVAGEWNGSARCVTGGSLMDTLIVRPNLPAPV